MVQHALPQLPWVFVFTGFLVTEPLLRAARIVYYNLSIYNRRAWTKVYVESLTEETTTVTFQLRRKWNPSPGPHGHIYLPSMAIWTSHPFSVAWVGAWESDPFATISENEKLPHIDDHGDHKRGFDTISCIVRARSGMTRKLYNHVSSTSQYDARSGGL
jgi:hypothetical protein